jgi:type III restriction enzyme
LLLPNLVVEDDFAFSFDIDLRNYAYNKRYQGKYDFKNHYYPHVGDLDDEADREEVDCAFFIDNLKEVKCWVRNLVRKPNAFWFQTTKDKFYPDFVALLHDERVLVVEYKGAHLWEGAKEDREIGGIWEARSNGRCLFIMVRDRQYESIRAKVQRK